jgi:hypothetical protein
MTAPKNSGKGAAMKRQIRSWIAPLLFAGLAGCAADTPPPMFCPQVAVLSQASMVTTFLPGRSDVAAQVTTAQITGVAGACQPMKQDHVLRVTFRAGFIASNGPANQGKTLLLPYFVALTRGDHIISKADYTIKLDFNGNASTAQATSKPVTVELGNVGSSQNVQVLVGFEMTQAELSYAAGHPMAAP